MVTSMPGILLSVSGNDDEDDYEDNDHDNDLGHEYDDKEDENLHSRYLIECLWRRPGHLGAQARCQLLHVQTLLVNIMSCHV